MNLFITLPALDASLHDKGWFALSVDVKVLGPGCINCRRLYSEAEKAVAEFAGPAVLTKIEAINEIMQYRILALPGLIINGELKSAGRVPNAAEIMKWLTAAAMQQESRSEEVHAGVFRNQSR